MSWSTFNMGPVLMGWPVGVKNPVVLTMWGAAAFPKWSRESRGVARLR